MTDSGMVACSASGLISMAWLEEHLGLLMSALIFVALLLWIQRFQQWCLKECAVPLWGIDFLCLIHTWQVIWIEEFLISSWEDVQGWYRPPSSMQVIPQTSCKISQLLTTIWRRSLQPQHNLSSPSPHLHPVDGSRNPERLTIEWTHDEMMPQNLAAIFVANPPTSEDDDLIDTTTMSHASTSEDDDEMSSNCELCSYLRRWWDGVSNNEPCTHLRRLWWHDPSYWWDEDPNY